MTPDGKPVGTAPIDPAFAELGVAQAEKAKEEPAFSPPPKKDPEAPYGRTMDGRPKKGPGGRRPKEKPRVTEPKAGVVKKDYTEELTGITQLAWGILATTSPADAGAVRLHGQGMVAAFNGLAQENAQVARGIEWLTSGSAYGAVVMATAPLIFQIMANHGRVDPERLAGLGVKSPADLAEMTRADVQALSEAQMAAQAAA
jgi:hypothetical protein